MSISVGKIVTQVNSKIVSGGQNAIDTARLVGSVEAIESRYSVVNCAALPAAADNTGRFIYIEDICAYRYSDGTQWTNDYDTTVSIISGELYGWGTNTCGTLGDGTVAAKCSPVRERCSAIDWCFLAAGVATSSGIKTTGQLWTWGSGDVGTLGDGSTVTKCSPVREICSATDWCGVSVSLSSTLAIKTSGQIWSWGNGNFGVLGDGTTTNKCSPVREICSATDWCQVSAGNRHTAAGIKTSGQLWTWGCGRCGQLGDGTSVAKCSPVREICSATDWCQVSVGACHTSAVKTTGQLWSWGYNNTGPGGALGDGTTTDRCSPVREFCSAADWCKVDAGAYHTLAIKTSGQLWGWGFNSSGRVGNGSSVSICSPVREFYSATDWCGLSAGQSHSAAVKTTGQIWSWGENTNGTLGLGIGIGDRCSPIREFCSATDWCSVSSGCCYTLGVRAIICKGFNEP